ncbi:hypothetical protein WCE39_08090 [Luteimonas sp. MJ174]|uniref:hypothetical protein n=1 Tax=Luteimonas sp. MJ174 TaxID=3129237 RepID=UPI0031BABE18
MTKRTFTEDPRSGLHQAQGQLAYLMELFGDELAAKQGWKRLDGIQAVRYYLMQKHNWLPAQVNSMSQDDLEFAMTQEMQGWTAEKALRGNSP